MLKILILILIIFFSIGCTSYRQEEVSFRNGNTALYGTLYIPTGKARHPAMIFVHGSGRSTRETFRYYADLFARKGLAVLIYDKRDIGSITATELVSSEDLAGDVLAAVQLLKGRDDIDAQRIGLWGGSQGSGIAAMATAQSNDIAFLISVSGGGVSYAELNPFQKANRLRAQGYSEAEIRDAVAAIERLQEYVRTRNNPEAAQAVLDRAWENRWASVIFPSRRIPTAEELKTWMQWRDIDGTSIPDWERVKVPVLAFWGEQDTVVPVQVSVERIREALRRAGNQDVTIIIVPRADHNLMRPPNPENLPAAEYLETMVEWTLKRARISG
ncbi:MAG: alpha/beta fold hydrolase [Acidobacteria bacterium]|jgi:pimeloyl-ACP methyl ester carboxylesterase|nr:alpha/beta fold hydrolase [Acidobacteriota bacterium]